MKFIIVFAALFAIAMAAPAENTVEVTRLDSDVSEDGFNYGYGLTDGTDVQANGELKNAGTENEAFVIRGLFSYVGDDGQTYSVNYVADENGYQPQGAHLPVAPVA